MFRVFASLGCNSFVDDPSLFGGIAAQRPDILSGFVLSTPTYTLHGVCGFLVPPNERNKVASTRPILRRNVYFQRCMLFDCCSFAHRDCLAVAYIDHVCRVGQSSFLAAGIILVSFADAPGVQVCCVLGRPRNFGE